MSFPISYSGGRPNFAYNLATILIPAGGVGDFGVLELECRPGRNLYVDAFVIVHGPDCNLSRLFEFGPTATTIIDDNLVTLPTSGLESLRGVLLTTGILRYGTTTELPPDQAVQPGIIPSRQMKPPVSDVTIREFQVETFRVPLHIPEGTTGAIRARADGEEVRLGIRWFEQATPPGQGILEPLP